MKTRLRTLRLRLLAMIFIVMAPLAAYTAIGARTTYSTAREALDTSQRDIAISLSSQIRALLVNAQQLVVTLAASAKSDDCTVVAASALQLNPRQIAVRAVRADGSVCVATSRRSQAPPGLADLLRQVTERGLDTAQPLNEGGPLLVTTLRHVEGNDFILVGVEPSDKADAWRGAIAYDIGQLDVLYNALSLPHDFAFAIRENGGLTVSVPNTSTQWFPSATLGDLPLRRPVERMSQDGEMRSYVAAPVANTNLTVVAGFRTTTRSSVRQQFLALLLAPLATMLVIWAAYSHMIREHVLRWTAALADTARQVAANRAARAPTNEAMPAELREVGLAFNTMIDGQAQRQRSLEEALARNQHLARELHHRVKNSLQIVQSYLGLAKRSETGRAQRALLVVECRVNALSIAYRAALADGEMKDLRLADYLQAVTSNVGAQLRRPDQYVDTQYALQGRAPLDLATPLGLIIVESLVALCEPERPCRITIRGTDEDGRGIITIRCDAPSNEGPPPRLLAGLVQQAEAERIPTDDPQVVLALRLPHLVREAS